MGELVSTKEKVVTIRDLFKRMESQIAAVAPRHLTPDRITRVAMTTIQRTPQLADCTPESLLGCMLECTQFGLEADGRRAHLVPYGKKCTLVIGFRGFKELAERHEKVKVVHPPRLVFEADEFEYVLGLDERLVHKPAMRPERGDIIAGYCIAELADGTKLFDVMWKHEIDAIRQKAAAKSSGPWVTDYGEMARKTVLKRLLKHVPASAELERATALDDAAAVGIPQQIEFIDLPAEPSAPPSDLDAIIQQEKAKPVPTGEPPKSLLPEDDSKKRLLCTNIRGLLTKLELPDQKRYLGNYGIKDVSALDGLDEENLNNLLGDIRHEQKQKGTK